MEKYYNVVDFLLNPQILLGDLIKNMEQNYSDFQVWIENYKIFFGSAELSKQRWRLIFQIFFNAEKNFLLKKQEYFLKMHGKTNLGKFFVDPIWININTLIRPKMVEIIHEEQTLKNFTFLSQLSVSYFKEFLGEFVNNILESEDDCFEYKVDNPPSLKVIHGKNLWLMK